MSLMRTVVEMVYARGKASIDDLMPELAAQGFKREQVRCALGNAATRRLIVCAGKQTRNTRSGSAPGEWFPADVPIPALRKKFEPTPQIACVWDLGVPMERRATVRGRICRPLGEWNAP